MAKPSRMTAGQTKDFKHILVSQSDHDRIASLAIKNDSTLTEEAAKALRFYWNHLDRQLAAKVKQRA